MTIEGNGKTFEVKDESLDKVKKYTVTSPLKKPVKCNLLMLDGTEMIFEIEESSVGNVLFLKACEHLNLLETEYFALTFEQGTHKVWLKKEISIKKQLKKAAWKFSFEVKFYPTDPCQLREELTRYQIYLQVRVNVLGGLLACSFVTQSILASYAFQSQLGDWDQTEMGSSYASNIRICPNQSPELIEEVVELHKNHRGMPADEAEYMYLDNCRVISQYGTHFVDVKDRNNAQLKLGISASGFLCHKDRIIIRRHIWQKVMHISFKRNKFYINLRSSDTSASKEVEEYRLADRTAAKHFWRLAVEHHAFFRLKEPAKASRGLFTGRNTNYLYGATQYQAGQAAEGIKRQSINFEREYHTMGRGVLGKGDGNETGDYQSATVDRTEETMAVDMKTRTIDRVKKNKSSVNHAVDEMDYQSKGAPETPGEVFFNGQLGGNYGDQQQEVMRVSMYVDDVEKTGPTYNKTPYPTESQKRLVSEDVELSALVGTDGSSSYNTFNNSAFTNSEQLQNAPAQELDYDKMLSDAILGVTDIDENLSVEKIEITKN